MHVEGHNFAGTRVLIIEDDLQVLELLEMQLLKDGFFVLTATTGDAGLRLAGEERPEVIILDIMMPGLDGYEVCRRLRQVTDACILFTSAMGQTEDIVHGLQMGGDDYVIKPYVYEELVNRMIACLRRRARFRVTAEEVYAREPAISTDPSRRLVYLEEGTVQLTRKEYAVFEYLMQNLGDVLSPDSILATVWGPEYVGEREVLDQVIYRLRAKLEPDPSQPKYLHTVRGAGYMLEVGMKA